MHICICLNVSTLVHVDNTFEWFGVRNRTDKSEYTEHTIFFICFYRCNFAGLYILHFHPLKNIISTNFFYYGIPHEVQFWILKCLLP